MAIAVIEKLARLKYTLDKVGVDWFKNELEKKRSGFSLAPAKNRMSLPTQGLFWMARKPKRSVVLYGFVENGRVVDDDKVKLKSALAGSSQDRESEIFRFTCNQNVILADVRQEDKQLIEQILVQFRILQLTEGLISLAQEFDGLCRAEYLSACFGRSQRYLPSLIFQD